MSIVELGHEAMHNDGDVIVKRASIAVLAGTALMLGACATATQDKENMLSAAGFNTRLADTPAKIAALRKFPPHRFFVQNENNKPVYFYADPTICGCLYYGTQVNYQNYRQLAFVQRISNQQVMAAEMTQQMFFDMGPWGGPFLMN